MKRPAGSFDRWMAAFDAVGLARLRRWVASHATGSVLEIGAGTGRNLSLYTCAAELVLLEPDRGRLAVAAERAARGSLPATPVCAAAERLPFGSGQFDTVVCTLALCSVQDLGAALSEMHRVTRPGGSLVLLEHVRLPEGLVARTQDRLAPWWLRASGGCHLDREPLAAACAAGWQVRGTARSAGGWLLRAVLSRPLGEGEGKRL